VSASIELRDYQVEACKKIVQLFNEIFRVCCVAPTGAGKTVIMAALIRHWLKRGRRILVLVHRVELVDQILEHVHAGTIASGRPENRDLPVQVATVQTLLSRKKPNADILILDECHHYVAEEWSQVVSAYPSSRVLGFTATPTRVQSYSSKRLPPEPSNASSRCVFEIFAGRTGHCVLPIKRRSKRPCRGISETWNFKPTHHIRHKAARPGSNYSRF